MTAPTKQDYDTLARWEEVSQQLADLKKEELTLRKELFTTFFPNPELGVNNLPLNADYVLKGTSKVSKTVDAAALDSIMPRLSDSAKDRVIKFKPSIDFKAFEYVDDFDKALIQECIVTKPATPTLAIVKPKR